jgi:hypothetical protein
MVGTHANGATTLAIPTVASIKIFAR